VFWEPLWIKLLVDFRFFPIQPSGYFVLQSDPLRIEATTAGKRGAIGGCNRDVWRGGPPRRKPAQNNRRKEIGKGTAFSRDAQSQAKSRASAPEGC
jgi:hypothetical protein